MYTRPLEECPLKFVRNGKPVFGTFKGHPQKLDIRGVKHPYGILPMPTFITNLRIKSRLGFFFEIGDFAGIIEFFDAKVTGLADVCFWDKKTGCCYSYNNVLGPTKRLIPHTMERAWTYSYKKSRFIRVSWDRANDRFSVVFDLKSHSARPGATCTFSGKFSDPSFGEVTMSLPAPTMRRSSAHTYMTLPVNGAINLHPRHGAPVKMESQTGSGFLEISRAYMKFRSHGEYLTGFGHTQGKLVQFRLATLSHDSVNQDLYNSNMLFVDGDPTPLPPVLITHPLGTMEVWNIQDTEGMVDLVFNPKQEKKTTISAVIARTQNQIIYGTLEGTLVTKDGQKVSFKGLTGIAKRYLIRL